VRDNTESFDFLSKGNALRRQFTIKSFDHFNNAKTGGILSSACTPRFEESGAFDPDSDTPFSFHGDFRCVFVTRAGARAGAPGLFIALKATTRALQATPLQADLWRGIARNARVRGSPYDWPSLFTGMVAFAGYPLLIEGKLVGVLGMFRA
jgi:hypothetical protein